MFSFVYNNKFGLPSLPPPGTFKGQTILITGATGGLGLATAVHFVNLGAATVIITARSLSKGLAAKASIIAQTSCAEDVIQVMELDMSTLASTKAFAERVKEEVKSVDYVLLNAGVLNTRFVMGKEGYEETVQVNALSTALLGILLLPWLKQAGKGKAHLGVVTSGLHRGVVIDEGKWPQKDIFQFFSREENWPAKGLYATSKLLVQYAVNELAKLAVGPDGVSQVIVNAICPGMVKSDLGRGYKTNFIMSFLVDTFMNLTAKSTEGGARSLVLAALTAPEENGKHFTNYQSDEDYNVEVQKNILGPEGQRMQAEVWKETLEILEAQVPGVKVIVESKA